MKTLGELTRNRPMLIVNKGQSVQEVVNYMASNNIGAVPVLDGTRLVGIFSERDVMVRCTAKKLDLDGTKIEDVMTKKVILMEAHDTYEDCLKMIGGLKRAGYKVLSVKEELRRNLIRKMENGDELFEGIVGYDKTVKPALMNSLLAKHDIILLGLRGQAKTKIARLLISLLDDYVPVIKGSEINDNPFRPVSKYAVDLVNELGDETKIEWISRDRRYGEKLATPDVTIADLIGDIDPIKAATQ